MTIRKFCAFALLSLLISCGGGLDNQPRNLDNACSIVDQKRGWLSDMQRAERKWGVPVAVQMSTIYYESKFIADAKTPRKYTLGVIPFGRRSSAYGYSQALDGTWEEYQGDQGQRRARRDDFSDAVDFIGWYMNDSALRLGIARSDGRNQYLAYHEGRTGYARGSYRNKSWLLRVANDVGGRALLYQQQLQSCGKI